VKIKYSNPKKARLISIKRWRFIRRRDLWASRRKQKKRKEGRHPNSGKLAIRPDHPRRWIKIKLCMVGGLQCVVIHVKCDPNRLRGYGAVWGRKWPFPITLSSGLYNSLYYRTSRDDLLVHKHRHQVSFTTGQLFISHSAAHVLINLCCSSSTSCIGVW